DNGQPRERVARCAWRAGPGDAGISTLADTTHHQHAVRGRDLGIAAGQDGAGGARVDHDVAGNIDAGVPREVESPASRSVENEDGRPRWTQGDRQRAGVEGGKGVVAGAERADRRRDRVGAYRTVHGVVAAEAGTARHAAGPQRLPEDKARDG